MPDQKAQLRATLLAARRELPRDVVATQSRRVVARLDSFAPFGSAAALLLYDGVQGEVETDAIRKEADRRSLPTYYPRVQGTPGELEFVRVAPGEALVPGRWGIAEPAGEDRFRPGEQALVLVPGLAFDARGVRLGRGRGCYDRAIAKLRPPAVVVGLAFSSQIIPGLPRDDWDQAVDVIVTDAEILQCQPLTPVGKAALAIAK